MYRKFTQTFSSRKKFTKDFFAILFASFLAGFSGILIYSLIGFFSSPENIGIYAQIFYLYLFFTTISNFGIEISTLKHTSENSDDLNKIKNILTTSSIIIIIISFITVVILCYTVKLFPRLFSSTDISEGFIYSLPAIILFALNKNFSAFLSGLRIMNIFSLVRILRWLFVIIFSFLLLWSNADFKYFFLVFVFSETIIFCFFLAYLFNYFILDFDFTWFKIHLKYGSANLISLVFSVLSNGIIIIISGYYLSEIQTSKITLMTTFSSLFILISNSIQINFNPVFAKKWSKNDYGGIQKYLNMIFSNTLKYSFPLYICSLILYEIYCNLFMSSEFRNTLLIYALFSLSATLTFIFSWPTVMLFLAGKIIQNLHRSIIIGSLNLLISYLSIKYLGFYGAGIAVLFNSIAAILISYYMIFIYLKINLYSNVRKSIKI